MMKLFAVDIAIKCVVLVVAAAIWFGSGSTETVAVPSATTDSTALLSTPAPSADADHQTEQQRPD